LYCVDAYAGWDPEYRVKIRVICARPYHALFMHNMLIRPTREELGAFGQPDYTIFNAGRFPANVQTRFMTSPTSVAINFERQEMYILGTEYAGEMKKGVFSIMNYLLPKRGVLSMHCAANEGSGGDVTLFFGLSGTGKTTLSADPQRRLIGDDEHGWSDDGVFNIEGGCYAKCIGLSPLHEPDIHRAIRFGAVLENVALDPQTREIDFGSAEITENTRAAYPLEFIPGAKIPAVGGHPKNIIFLTCDAFGVLPPVARLSPQQAMYYFISGYTAKVAGTEVGVREPQATFSACFGAAFLLLHPTVYARMLAERIERHGADAWLINTGWSGGSYGVGSRIKLPHTRAIVDAIHGGQLHEVPTVRDGVFGLDVPAGCPGVPPTLLQPATTWSDGETYRRTAEKLAGLFQENFAEYAEFAGREVVEAGPQAAAPAAAARH
ncbi:MAG: phosphoenolpyruvate carboxykinase (ATP), partial [Planctomycetia bacterium]|nr:phosphoenolpyruvate carboxykinase (ATP) [Planctomycetia bacterium]